MIFMATAVAKSLPIKDMSVYKKKTKQKQLIGNAACRQKGIHSTV